MRVESYIWSKELENRVIFLSASFPQPERGDRYFKTANPLEITDAVIAIARAIFTRKGKLVFGGHPTISPLILSVGEEFLTFFEKENYLPFIFIYQSDFYKEVISKYTHKLVEKRMGEIIWTPIVNNDREKSLYEMRKRMLSDTKPIAAIFIGGMEGVEEEFSMFVKIYPKNPVYPIGSTGGSAKMLLEKHIIQPKEKGKWSFSWEYGFDPNNLKEDRIFPSLANKIISDLKYKIVQGGENGKKSIF